MSQQRYTIVIENGKLVGISQHTGNLDAVPVNLADLKKEVKEINDSALARLVDVDAEITAKESEKLAAKDAEKQAAIQAVRDKADAAESALTAIESAIANPDVDDAATLEIAKREVEARKLTKKQKELAELDRQIAEAQARKAELRGEKKD